MTNLDKVLFWRDRVVARILRDRHILNILGQIIVLIIVISLIAFFGNNLANNFRRLGFNFDFGFIVNRASFTISDPPIPYTPADPYYRAILIGIINSLKIMFWGIIIATILGIIIGISKLSDNWLVRKISTGYVELFRNTPLLLQLFFWYFAVFLKLPKIDAPLVILKKIFFTNRGIYLPGIIWDSITLLGLISIIALVTLNIIFWRNYLKTIGKTGKREKRWLSLIIFNNITLLIIVPRVINWDLPQLQENTITGGINLTPEFSTLLIGLSLYTAAFIAEVVRGGIQSVNKGQWEAAKALGLKPSLVMQLIIFPQALRVMIPPLTSEFLNLAKNSSLAIAVGYNDIYAISNTISNQTGKAVEILLIVMVTYLTINLFISIIMNWLNYSVQLKER